jgi:hypothetical protein
MQNESLPASVQLRLEEVCARFEAAWQSAGPAAPRVEEYLGAAAGPERTALLRELLRLDVHYRRHHGESEVARAIHGLPRGALGAPGRQTKGPMP